MTTANLSPAVRNFLQIPVRPIIIAEQRDISIDHENPAFLCGAFCDPNNPGEWYHHVLPRFQNRLTFIINGTTECFWVMNMLASQRHWGLAKFVHELVFPGFYWFSGITKQRTINQSLDLAARCEKLHTLRFTLHTAGTTESIYGVGYGEKLMIEYENAGDLVTSQMRKNSRVDELIRSYDLNKVQNCANLRFLEVQYIDCDRVRIQHSVSDPMAVMEELKDRLIDFMYGRTPACLVDIRRIYPQ